MKKFLPILISGLILGLFLGYGMPGKSSLILSVWNMLSQPLRYFFSPQYNAILFLVGLIIAIVTVYLFIKPLLNAILAGLEGIVAFAFGMTLGIAISILLRFEVFISLTIILLILLIKYSRK